MIDHTLRRLNAKLYLSSRMIACPTDRLFVAILYTSDSDKIMRYTDEVRSFYLATLPRAAGHCFGFVSTLRSHAHFASALVRDVMTVLLTFKSVPIDRVRPWSCANGR